MPNPYDPYSVVRQGEFTGQMRDPNSVVRAGEMQMPRGGGFGQQGGYQGQVYNTPQTGNGFGNMGQTLTPQMKMQLMQALQGQGGQASQGDMRNVQPQMPMRPQQLSPEQIMELRRQQHQQHLNQVFDQERMKGMLE